MYRKDYILYITILVKLGYGMSDICLLIKYYLFTHN